MIAYAIAYAFSGWIVDILGPRVSLALFVGWWSIANSLTGLVRGVFGLGFVRFMLGLGEAGGYTASPKVVAEWFPARERGIAVGLYSVGGAFGAVIAPVLVVFMAGRFGWRGVFAATPLFGLTFVALWLWLYRKPEGHPCLTDAERSMILSERKRDLGAPGLEQKKPWPLVLRHPAIWALMGARFLTDPVWYFINFWLPKYLNTERHLDQAQLAGMWRIYLAGDIGFFASGFLSGFLVKRGWEPAAARRRLLLVCAWVVPLAPLIAMSPGIRGAFFFSAVIAMAHTAWLAGLTTYIVDMIPGNILGTAFGFIAAGSALGGIFMNEAVGWVVTHYSYRPCFYAMVPLHPTAFLLVWLFARKPWVVAVPKLA